MERIWTRRHTHYESLGIEPNRICADGIADSAKFARASHRILVVMREVNDYAGGDVRELLRSGPRYQVWHTVARWTAGILNGFPEYPAVDRLDAMRAALQSIASINLKKTSGGATADLATINAYAHNDRHLLCEQIAEIDPTIIVACGTFDQLVWLLELKVDPDAPRRSPTFTPNGRHLVLPWIHPGRASNRSSYEQLRELVRGHLPLSTLRAADGDQFDEA